MRSALIRALDALPAGQIERLTVAVPPTARRAELDRAGRRLAPDFVRETTDAAAPLPLETTW